MEAMWPRPMNTQGTWRGISTSSELGFEHGDRGWKALDEHNVIETPNGGFEILKEKQNYDAPSLKRVTKA
jgi:hypothetical protein